MKKNNFSLLHKTGQTICLRTKSVAARNCWALLWILKKAFNKLSSKAINCGR